MPFTPYHLGPAIAIGLPFRRFLHTPTFLVASVVLDIEPFLVLLMGLNYPLHGYFHTLIVAAVTGAVLGSLASLLEGTLSPLYRLLLLEGDAKFKTNTFAISGVLGTVIHVLLDAPLYPDILPFYPLAVNPLYDPGVSLQIYSLSFWAGVFGIIYYVFMIISSLYRRKVGRTGRYQ
ncbi:MAG: hydrolase [Candidatus Verstraetearchaeota archaeon]|nr:hydrolase [Candidatus Verstraetearchaeota archaeon]